MWNTLAMPGPEVRSEYRTRERWRDSTFLDDLAIFLDDLAIAAGEHPTRSAVSAYQGGELARTPSYAELVERFASALTALCVGHGDVVVLYLPNLYVLTPLYLACHRIGAVGSPMIPVPGARELAYVLTASRAKVCVTVDSVNGVDYGARPAEVAPDTLAHRVVLGNAAATGAVDFTEFFPDTPWEIVDGRRAHLAEEGMPAPLRQRLEIAASARR